MRNVCIFAGIVTYNPDVRRLKQNIEGIINQIDTLLIFDNNSENVKDIVSLCEKYKKRIHVSCSEINRGIAFAFNYIMNFSIENGAEWVVLLDQDTVCPEGMITEYKKYLYEDHVAIIAPVLVDKRRARRREQRKVIDSVVKVVSSGSMLKVSVYKKIGKFEEILFIDMVDYEYCMRVRINGYKILQLGGVILDQEFGTVKPNRFNKVFHCLYVITGFSIFTHLEYVPVFNPNRVMYSFRNWTYCLKKYRLYSKKMKSIYQILFYGLRNYLRTGFSWTYLKAYIRGLIEGMRMKPEVYKTESIHKIDLM